MKIYKKIQFLAKCVKMCQIAPNLTIFLFFDFLDNYFNSFRGTILRHDFTSLINFINLFTYTVEIFINQK